ncbi:M10 family metallopeptidase C-terminal domain-containing protein [Sphingobium sufflavum]|nr:M10 family metallopeptidase C-terminal domain-containing protein [Sphingobium sufflavum]
MLYGEQGADRLIGGAGDDLLYGGAGADRFAFTKLSEFGTGTLDQVMDFVRAEGDKIDLSKLDADVTTPLPAAEAFTFIGTAAFGSVAGQLRYAVSGVDAVVSGDVDGNGAADFSFIVRNVTSLQVSDFVL